MNPIPAVLALASLAAAAAPVAQGETRQQQPPPDLRRTVQQYPGGGEPPRRELTQVQRAELRRQLSEFAPPPSQRRR
jgi:hypothetical protein